MINRDFFLALEQVAKESKLDEELLISSIEAGLASAYKKENGESRAVTAKINKEAGMIEFFAYQIVVEGEPMEDNQLSLEEAQDIKPDAKIGDVIGEDITPLALSRIAAQTAKQVILQRINEAKRKKVAEEISDKSGELVSAIVRRVENNTVYVEINNLQMEGIMGITDQVRGEKYNVNDIIKVYVRKLRETMRGETQVVVSRSCAGFVKKLFELEVPEMRFGIVKVKNIVREAGVRTKMAVYSDDPNVEPALACIGTKAERINNVVRELGGEKIDVIQYVPNIQEYITRALSPVRSEKSNPGVITVKMEDDGKRAQVVVADDKLSLAIGKGGMNAKLAAKLTGVKLDIKSFSSVTGDASIDEN